MKFSKENLMRRFISFFKCHFFPIHLTIFFMQCNAMISVVPVLLMWVAPVNIKITVWKVNASTKIYAMATQLKKRELENSRN